jgi:hypothetical protein
MESKSFEVFTVVKIQDAVCWVVTPCSVAVGYNPEDGGRKVLRNFGTTLQHYTASQPRRPRLGVKLDFRHIREQQSKVIK